MEQEILESGASRANALLQKKLAANIEFYKNVKVDAESRQTLRHKQRKAAKAELAAAKKKQIANRRK